MAFWNRDKKAPAPQKPAAQPQAQAAPTPERHAQQAATSTQSGPAALSQVRNVIAIASGKGGVGKSTVTTNLAVALRYMGSTVGLLDADVYGPSQPGMLGQSGKKGETTPQGALVPLDRGGIKFLSMGLYMPGDGPLVWRAPMAMKAIQQFLTGTEWGALDYLLIDLPPGTGDVQLTLAQQARLAGAVIVTTPQEVALGIAKKGLEMFRQLNIPILGIVENMSGFECGHCGEVTAIFKEGGGEKLARQLGVPFLGALPLDPEIMQSGDNGVPVLEKSSDSRAAQAILAMANRLDQEARAASKETSTLEPKSYSIVPQASAANGTRAGSEPGSPTLLKIEWADGVIEHTDAFTLRVNCGCANCVDENTGRPLLDPARVPADVKLTAVQGVGRYALTASFSDGHSTGIYPFKKLRGLQAAPRPAASAAAGASLASGESGHSHTHAQHTHGPGCSHGHHDHSHSGQSLEQQITEFLEQKVNPSVAGHGGKIELVSIQGTSALMRMSGGCQGCGAAKSTLKDGVERALLAQFPQIREVVDVTDHAAGSKPYYASGGAHTHNHGPSAH